MKTRRIMAILLSVLMMLSCFVATTASASATTSGIWTYETRGDGSIMITGCSQAYGALVVPASIDGHAVYGIGPNVGWNMLNSSVEVSEGIQYIGEWAFGWNLTDFTRVSLPSTLTTMAKGAFVAPFVLASATIPAACVNFPNASVASGNGLAANHLVAHPFFGMSNSNGEGGTITLYTDEAEAEIEACNAAMVEATGYKAININRLAAPLVGDGALFNYVDAGKGDGSILITGYAAANTVTGKLNIPATYDDKTVYGIANGAFYGLGQSWEITSVNIAEGVQFIGDSAFLYSPVCTSISLPETLTTIGDNAFALMGNLASATIPAACVNFVDDTSYDCPLGGAKNNGLGIFYAMLEQQTAAPNPVVTCYTLAAKDALDLTNSQNIAFGCVHTINIDYQGVEVKQGGARVAGLDPSHEWIGSNFALGYATPADASDLAVQDVTATISSDYKTLTVVANVQDKVPDNVMSAGAAWESECFEVFIDPTNGYTQAMADANDRSSLLQLRISRGGLLSGRWLASTQDTASASPLFDGKFAGSFSRAGDIDTYTFTVNVDEFDFAEGDDIGINFVSQSGALYDGAFGATFFQLRRKDGTFGTWDAQNWDYVALGVSVGGDGQSEHSDLYYSYDKADNDCDVTLTSYSGNVASVVVPAFITANLDSGDVQKSITIVAANAFANNQYLTSIDFEDNSNVAIFQTGSVQKNDNLASITIPYGTRCFSTANWKNDYEGSTWGNVLGYNNAIQQNPSLTNIYVGTNGEGATNRFSLVSNEGILCMNGNSVGTGVYALVHFPEGRLGNQSLPAAINTIYCNAFINNAATITTATATYENRALYLDASNVQTVYSYAFNGATALKTIDLRNCTRIDADAFDNWTSEEKASLIIKGYEGSYIDSYCETNGIGFEAVACSNNHANTHEVFADVNDCLYNVVCDECNEVVGTVYHHTTWTIDAEVEAPTCTAAGSGIATCDGCGTTDAEYVIPALGHDYVAVITAPTATEQGYTTYTCSRCADSYVTDYTDPTGPVGPVDATVTFGHSMSLENRLSMAFLVRSSTVPADATNIYMEVCRDDVNNGGKTEITTLYTANTLADSALRFYYDGIAAAEMSAVCYANVYYTSNGVDYVSQEDQISVKDWAEGQLAKAATAANLKTLLVDMLNYGASAQTKFGVATDALANAGIGAYQNLGTQTTPSFVNVRTSSGTGLAVATTLLLENAIEMVFKVPKAAAEAAGCTTDNMIMKVIRSDTGAITEVTCSNEEANAYAFNFSGMATSEFGVAVTAQLFVNGEAKSILRTFSIESYLAAQYDVSDAATQAMFNAMKNFSASAAVYFGA